jgi:hypothetical protein
MVVRSRRGVIWIGGGLLAVAALVWGVRGVESQDRVRGPVAPGGTLDYVPPGEIIIQYNQPQPKPLDAETDTLIRTVQARSTFGVDGTGFTVAVLDTGLRTTHVDFAGKVVAVQNFTTDDGGNPAIVTDLNGHGTNVAGVAIGNGIHTGIATGGRVAALKVLTNAGSGQSQWSADALDWVIANRTLYNITVVNMSLGSNTNFNDDNIGDSRQAKIQTLRNAGVAVCIAAGNSFFGFNSVEGMAAPAIIRESISVGAVYDSDIGGPINYGSGATAFTTGPRRITPFSQRLHSSTNANCKTDVFAPGAALTAAGNANDTAESTSHGTSQACPVVAGLCLLAQQYAVKKTGNLPTVDQLEKWLVSTTPAVANTILDGDDEDDNVVNTNKTYIMADAVQMLTAADADLTVTPPPPPPPNQNTVSYVWNSANRTLTLNGDAANNANIVTATWRGDRITLATSGATRIQVGATQTTSVNIVTGTGKVSIAGDMKGGNDSVTLISMPIKNVTIKLAAGNDKLTVSYCNIEKCAADGGAGTDTFVNVGSIITTPANVSFP